MKQVVVFLLSVWMSTSLRAQNNAARTITPALEQQIQQEVELLIPAYMKQLAKRELTKDQLAFSVDTFRIAQIVAKRIDIDYTTLGINTTIDTMAAAYDKLMNKYYSKLMQLLQPADKQVLVQAQKVWLAYRDAEAKLIGTMAKPVYSGGGTIQSNIVRSAYADLIVKRTIELFNYYDGVIKDE